LIERPLSLLRRRPGANMAGQAGHLDFSPDAATSMPARLHAIAPDSLVTRLVGWLRYALDRRVLRLPVAGAGNIGDGNNANQLLVSIQNSQATHLMLRHHLRRLHESFVLKTIVQTLRHYGSDLVIAGSPIKSFDGNRMPVVRCGFRVSIIDGRQCKTCVEPLRFQRKRGTGMA
jgi:hypothetical protein